MTTEGQFLILWHDRGRPPKIKPNPDYPEGKDIDTGERPACKATLPYPTGHKNIGTWIVVCAHCNVRVGVTAASRPDDPRSIMVPCKREATQ